MLLPSEIESRSLIPAIRAIISRRLVNEYGMKEEDVARLLGITQAAVSNYIRGTRGDAELAKRLMSEPSVVRRIDEISKELATNRAFMPSTMAKYIGLLNYIRHSLLICDIHHAIEKIIDKDICKACEDTLREGMRA
ncbi:MAG: helix-turn-helix domain-containing protein [Candidatus Nitrosocaldus sp.]|nr:helix-turn-helix domain-containing protein [Candidatus Nitrosocaldus sp.]MCS7141611.1 helix-turn-helix domain-containing protein [Candidatus Nitrosocaldus sp.]MDW8000575.1 helix-turn-helix domain-containing protein [Candidatus Nitrosocaldus sp.]MDW8276075.1 helix-turn-helix domain-containing protein [Candidatus Nitrosocaldus sp.]